MICMQGVNEILLIKHFLVDLLHMRFCIWSFLSLSQLSVALELHCKSKALLAGLLNKDWSFGKCSISEWPQVPQASLAARTVHSLSGQRWNFNEEHWAMFFQRRHLASGLVTWRPGNWLYLWFLLISLRLCWLPPWASWEHPTFRHRQNSKDG